MIKNILVVLAVLFVTGTHVMAYNYYDMSNPASPINPLNPANPVSPLNPRHMNSHFNAKTSYKTTNNEEYKREETKNIEIDETIIENGEDGNAAYIDAIAKMKKES